MFGASSRHCSSERAVSTKSTNQDAHGLTETEEPHMGPAWV